MIAFLTSMLSTAFAIAEALFVFACVAMNLAVVLRVLEESSVAFKADIVVRTAFFAAPNGVMAFFDLRLVFVGLNGETVVGLDALDELLLWSLRRRNCAVTDVHDDGTINDIRLCDVLAFAASSDQLTTSLTL